MYVRTDQTILIDGTKIGITDVSLVFPFLWGGVINANFKRCHYDVYTRDDTSVNFFYSPNIFISY